MTNIDQLRTFYLCDGGQELSLFDIWEGGAANGDSVTPSTYSVKYRQWMVKFLCDVLARTKPPTLLSVGCGNAFVEADVARAGYDVLCVDVLEEAVDIARRKGLNARHADVSTWVPEVGRWGVVYADGLLAHLYDQEDGLRPILKHLHGWIAPGTGILVISNDSARDGLDAQPAPGVPAHWLSADYLTAQCREAGFDDVQSTIYTYNRPLSGPRDRAIITARVAPTGYRPTD
jgi:SAM-dependent methyltransferase